MSHLDVVLTSGVSSWPVGGDGREKGPGSSSQQVHCVLGLCLPVKNRVVSGHDHHERRRLEVGSLSLHCPSHTWKNSIQNIYFNISVIHLD